MRVSPSTAISLVALFISLGSVGYAANGMAFLLGKVNAATAGTYLGAKVNGPALQIGNGAGGGKATALTLSVAAGHPPMRVNSTTEVTNFNADLLDGLDSTQFPRFLVVPFTVEPGADSAPITVPANRPVSVMGVTFIGQVGVGQVTLLRIPGVELKWTGLETPSIFPPSITSGGSSTTGTHIVFLDNVHEVDIEVDSADTIRVHNSAGVARTGNVTLIW